jgi:phage tail sheath protein FI
MPTLSYPGVYVEEVSSGVRPIETASTSTPAFVGLAEMGPDTAASPPTGSWHTVFSSSSTTAGGSATSCV